MRAAILTTLNAPLTIADLTPPAPQCGQVEVHIHTTTICGAQLGEIEGRKGPDKYLPHLLGHEASGHVTAIGPGVSQIRVGDTVVLHWRPSLGIQAAGALYRWNDRIVNAGPVTTFQEIAIVSENRCTVIPPDTDLETAALYGCAITTAFGVISNEARVRPGESVVVLGSGGVGLCEIMAAKLCSALPIVALDCLPERLVTAKQFGATHTINTRFADWQTQLKNILPHGADAVIENTGVQSLIEASCTLTHPRGRTILVGVPRAGETAAISTLPLHFDRTVRGSCGGGTIPHEDIPRYMRLAASGAFDPRTLITHRFPLEDINTALDLMRAGKSVRCAIHM